MSIPDMIAERAKELPAEKQQELLDFADFLARRSSARAPLADVRGLWKHQGFDISAEQIDDARREMWGNFPRDFP